MKKKKKTVLHPLILKKGEHYLSAPTSVSRDFLEINVGPDRLVPVTNAMARREFSQK